MKKLYTTIILAFVFINVNAQAPNWIWANGAGGMGDDKGYSTATDAAGNVFVVGSYSSSSIVFGTTTLTNAGGYDLFITKYNASGNLLWAKSIGGTGNDNGNGIATDASGNVYVTGNYDSPSINFGTTTLTNVDSTDIFIVKYNSQGNVLWAKSVGGTGGESGEGIATDAFGNIYITGNFCSATLSFGANTLTNTDTTGTSCDIFILKYGASGNEIWARRAGCFSPFNYFGNDYGYKITTDLTGNVFVTGMYTSYDIIFGSDTINGFGNGSHLFVAKYDGSGNVLWARGENYRQYSYSSGNGITTDASGNVYVTGDFNAGYFIIGNDTIANVANPGNTDIFLVKFDASGNVLWLKGAGSTGFDRSLGTCTDAAGNVFITGFYSYTINFGTITLGPAAATNIFVVKYDASGNDLWAQTSSGSYNEGGYSITTDATGYLYLTGYYTSLVFLGNISLSFTGGNGDMFIAKLGNNGLGFDEKPATNEIYIYPNPSNGIFTFSKNIKTVEVFNMLGELLLSQGNVNQINLNAFPKGVYVARINGEFVSKLVKE